jgi:hypothetical protein
MDDKKKLYRAKALKHYYNNLDYYRNYYILNKDKLINYSKEYRKKLNKSISQLENKSKLNRSILIQYGDFVVSFD